MRALSAQIGKMAISVPLGSGDYDAPGYLHIGYTYSCVPDAAYPWDPAVLAAIREIVPDAMPLIIRSVWQWSNYAEHGHLDPPLVLMRHGIGRAIRDPYFHPHDFLCEMPTAPIPGLCIPGRDIADCRPNYIETNWQDADLKPYGFDLPGAFLPFDWRLFQRYRIADLNRQKLMRESVEAYDSDGNPIAKGAGDELVGDEAARVSASQASRRDTAAYVRRDLLAYHSVVPSDVELKEQLLGQGQP